MKVLKFGGASINSVERIRDMGNILRSHTGEKILVVVSAMGKTTNALEKVADAFFDGHKKEALEMFEQVKQMHFRMAKYLVTVNWKQAEERLQDHFTEVEWLLHDKPVRNYNYYYDQVVSSGEMMSSTLVSSYLSEAGMPNQWIDVRDIIRTDDNFRDAGVDWELTGKKVREGILPLFETFNTVMTQGFIGATRDNESTTLGREGSDYSAAIFANLLHAESLTIWKDVEGVMNADPREFPDARVIRELSYGEVVEMAYYGAQVIHPKTIKPLANRNIPLYVRCFLDPQLPGTVISNRPVHGLPPVIVLKKGQVLMELSTRDFSFVEEKPIGQFHQMLVDARTRPNLSQNGAVSLLCVLDDDPEKIENLAIAASAVFDVRLEKNLTLLTIRHYDEATVERLTRGRTRVLEQKTLETIQVLLR